MDRKDLAAGVTLFGLAALGAGVAVALSEPEPEPRGALPMTVAELVATDVVSPAEALEAAQSEVERLEDEVYARDAMLADLAAELELLHEEGEQAAARRAAAKLAWDAQQQELERLELALAHAIAERDGLKLELEQALAELEQVTEERDTAVHRGVVYKAANAANLWMAFREHAKVEICDKGTRRRHARCHAQVEAFLDEGARQRFASCVLTQQATPRLGQLERGEELTLSDAERMPSSLAVPGDGYFVQYCDPTLPEAVAADDLALEAPVFERLASR